MARGEHLNAIFQADRAARAAEAQLLATPQKALEKTLRAATEEALGLNDSDESEIRLRRLADLWAQVPGKTSVQNLLDILDHPEPAVRVEAGESLKHLAYERFKDVAAEIETRLKEAHRGVGMQELPFILAEVHDPDPLPLTLKFLSHPEAEVVGATVEALVALGDERAVEALEALIDDKRPIAMEDLEEGEATLGELATDALRELLGPAE